MANQNKGLPSLWERSKHNVISENETDTALVALLRTNYRGTNVICKIPKHSKLEEEKLAADITYALMQIAYTGQDISQIKSMEILVD